MSSTGGGTGGRAPLRAGSLTRMSILAGALVDLVLPRACVGCGEPGTALCSGCRGDEAPFLVLIDGTDDTVVAATRYGAGVRRAIIAYKERDRRDLARVLGAMLALAVNRLLADVGAGGANAILVAPPSSRAVVAARGGDHVLRVARAAVRSQRSSGRGPPLSIESGVVRTTRRVRDSAGLSIVERERNLRGSMAAVSPRDPGPRRAVVVVDDIVTTGATVRETTRALRVAGWPVLGAAVVAATPRRLTGDPLAGHGWPV